MAKTKKAPPEDETAESAVVQDEAQDEAEVDSTVEATEEVVEDVQPSWRERLGGEYAGLDDDAALSRLQQTIQQAGSAHAAQQAAQQYQYLHAQSERQLHDFKAAQQKAQAEAQQPKKSKWEPPEFDQAWLQMVTHDEAGNLIAKPGARPDLPEKVLAYAEWKRSQEHRLFTNPAEFFMEQVQDKINELVQQRVQSSFADDRAERAVAEFDTKHKDVLYDGQGNFSQAGQWIVNQAKGLMQAGLTNHRMALEQAMVQLNAHIASTRTQPTNGNTNAKQKETLLRNGATRKPNRDGAQSGDAKKTPINLKMNFGNVLTKRLAEAGFGENDTIDSD